MNLTYTYDEAYKIALGYFNGDELATEVFLGKYALRDGEGNLVEASPTQMHKRLAKEFARIEAKYPNPMSEDEIFGLLDGFKFIVPQGSPMSGIGNPYQIQSLSNCFVVSSPLDSYSGILKTDEELVQISKRRGGVGVDISHIRPRGLATRNAAKTTDGLGVFMERFSNSIREVGQCIEENQRVLTRRGLTPIKDVKAGKDFVWTKAGWVRVLDVLNNGQKEIFETTTARGFKIKTTLDHVFLDARGKEAPLRSFSINDDICLLPGSIERDKKEYIKLENWAPDNFDDPARRYNRNIVVPERLTPDLAYLIGYSYGDGYVDRKNGEPIGLSLACSNDWPGVKDRLAAIASKIFNYNIIFSPGDGDLDDAKLGSKVVVMWLAHNNLLKEKADSICLPQKIIDSPSDVQMAFFSGVFDADGYASGKKKGYVLASIQKEFLLQVQKILLSNGIVSRLHSEDRQKQGWNTLHTLCVVGSVSQTILVERAAKWSEKINQSKHVSKRENIITPYIPQDFAVQYGKIPYIQGSVNMSLAAYQKYLKESARTDMPELVFKDSIENIAAAGVASTFDLVLETEHLFWCEGFIVHNSGRRGALMTTISIHHPEIRTFINIKKDRRKVTGSNISIRLTDEFMTAVKNGTGVQLRWPVDAKEPKIIEHTDARALWDEICQSAWENAEPGILFWDNILTGPADVYDEFRSVSTNPCSEIPLCEYDSCRLILINLTSFVSQSYTDQAEFDFHKYWTVVQKAQRLMDDLVDLELENVDKIIAKIQSDPEPEDVKDRELNLWKNIREKAVRGRRTGLGLTGVGDTIAALGDRYGDEKSLQWVDTIYADLARNSYLSSVNMAAERGAFPAYDYPIEKSNAFIKRVVQSDLSLAMSYPTHGRRNIANLTTAPAGSVSVLTQTTSGIEPAFLLTYVRRRKINPSDQKSRVDFVDDMGDRWQEYRVFHHGFKQWLDVQGVDISKVENWDELVARSPYAKSTSNDIDWKASVQIQGVAQRWIDHAISKTCNLPNDVSVDLVKEIYMSAWEAGCKGFTVYRDGSRTGVLVADKKEDAPTPETKKFEPRSAPKRPEVLECDVYHLTVNLEKWVIFVGLVDGLPYEVMGGLSKFVNLPKRVKKGKIAKVVENDMPRYDLHYDYEESAENETIIRDLANLFENPTNGAFTRMVSLSLRHGASVQFVVEQLLKGSDKDSDMFSLSKGLSRVLKGYIKDGTKTQAQKKCGQCGTAGMMAFIDGCVNCLQCGWSKC